LEMLGDGQFNHSYRHARHKFRPGMLMIVKLPHNGTPLWILISKLWWRRMVPSGELLFNSSPGSRANSLRLDLCFCRGATIFKDDINFLKRVQNSIRLESLAICRFSRPFVPNHNRTDLCNRLNHFIRDADGWWQSNARIIFPLPLELAPTTTAVPIPSSVTVIRNP
jgi:hypothetical protein